MQRPVVPANGTGIVRGGRTAHARPEVPLGIYNIVEDRFHRLYRQVATAPCIEGDQLVYIWKRWLGIRRLRIETGHCNMMKTTLKSARSNQEKPLFRDFKHLGKRKHPTRKTPKHKGGGRSHLCLS